MKLISSVLVITLTLSGVGCASASRVATLDPVGPRASQVTPGASEGYLQVYSVPEAAPSDVFLEAMIYNNDFGQNEFLHSSTRTAYALYTADGQLLKRIQNNTEKDGQAPSTVVLAPGTYRIEARAINQELVSVPVSIVPGQTTRVHLDGKWQPSPDAAGLEVVSLPHGVQVGWRAASLDQTRFQVRERIGE